MRRQIAVSVFVIVFCVQCLLLAAETQEVVGSISEVIVYRSQALVTRRIELELGEGGSEIIVGKLPEQLIADSLNAQGSGEVSISSVRYREKKAEADTREEVKALETQIEEVRRGIKHTERNIQHGRNLWERYDPFWRLTVDVANKDFDRALLEVEPIKQLTVYLEAKFTELHQELLELEDRRDDLQKELVELGKKLNELQVGRGKMEREAVLLVNSPRAGEAVVKLNYLVKGANWLPQYNLRAGPEKGIVRVEYNALLHQTSGEDWDKVSLSLSTAQPAMMAAPPGLEPMEVKLGAAGRRRYGFLKSAPVDEVQKGRERVMEQPAYRDLSDEFKAVQSLRRQVAVKGKAAQRELNLAAASNQMMELWADKDAVAVIKAEAKRFARTEGVSVTYELGGKLSMPSRSEQQLLGIAGFESKADFLGIGTPLLTDYVYLQGDVANDSGVIMLAGPASMYRDGEFVGKGRMGLVTIGEKFTAGFGVDSQIKIAREFKDKKIDTLWGNRVEKYEYRIAIENYKNSKVKLRLLERIPYTEDKELEITSFTTNTPLSTDAEYLRAERENGILRWDLELAPNTTDEKARVVTYSYSMKYDNDMQIQSVPVRR